MRLRRALVVPISTVLAGLVALTVASSAEALVYWSKEANSNGRGAAIARANLDGTGTVSNLIAGIDPGDVAVSRSHIYWTETPVSGDGPVTPPNSGSIGRARLNGTQVRRRFITGVQPSSLAVHGSHLYWTNLVDFRPNSRGSIGRANLSGKEVKRTFIPAGPVGYRVGGVAVDDAHIYWGEDGEVRDADRARDWSGQPSSRIVRANIDGTDVRRSFLSFPRNWPFAIPPDVAVDGTHLYWTNSPYQQNYRFSSPNAIGRASKDATPPDCSRASNPAECQSEFIEDRDRRRQSDIGAECANPPGLCNADFIENDGLVGGLVATGSHLYFAGAGIFRSSLDGCADPEEEAPCPAARERVIGSSGAVAVDAVPSKPFRRASFNSCLKRAGRKTRKQRTAKQRRAAAERCRARFL